MARIDVPVRPELKARVAEVAKSRDCSAADIVRFALLEYLAKLEPKA